MRWIVRLAGVLVILVLAAGAALVFIPTERIAGLVSDQVRAATGRAMTVDGPIRPTLWPVLGVSTGPVTFANADWSSEGPMLRAEGLSVGVDALALLGGDIRVTGFRADAPEVVLERVKDGRANWELGNGTSSPGGGGSGAPAVALDEAVLAGARVIFIDHAGGSRTELADLDVRISLPGMAGPAEVALTGRMNGQVLSLETRIDGFQAFLGRGAVPVALSATVGGSNLTFEGDAGLTPLAAGGRLRADLGDLPALFALIGLAPPALPATLRAPLELDGAVTWSEAGTATLRGGKLRFGPNTVSADADLTLSGDTPALTARLSAGSLDLSALTDRESAAPAEGAGGWSTDRIDVSALHDIDADIVLRAERIDLGLATLGRTHLLTTLKDGRAVNEIREMAAYDGAVTGSFVVNGRGGLSVRANLTGAGVALGPLLSDLADQDRLTAKGDVTLSLLGVGDDMNALMQSLSGDGALRLGAGELRGFDLAGMIRNLDPGFVGEGQRTIFDSVTATFDVAGGQLRSENLTVLSPLLNVTGSGRVGLGPQDIDYRLLPVLLQGGDGQGIRVPVTVKGPWQAPRFALDVEALVTQRFGEQIETLKSEAGAAVTAKIEEELGVDLDGLGGLEGVIRNGVDTGAAGGLLDLLGGNR